MPVCLKILFFLRFVALAAGASIEITSCAYDVLIGSSSGDFTLSSNVWNAAPNGSQCVTLLEGNTAFEATWNWRTDASEVHSFPSVVFNSASLPMRLSGIHALNVSGVWSAYPTSVGPKSKPIELDEVDARFNVAIDMFADPDPGNAQNATLAQYEIMIWLARFGNAEPIGYSDLPVMVQQIGDYNFSLYEGNNHRGNKAYSWLSSVNIESFDIDTTYLIKALTNNNLVPSNAYLGLVDYGSEAFHATENITFAAHSFDMNLTLGTAPVLNAAPPSTAHQDHKIFWVIAGLILMYNMFQQYGA